MPINGRDYVIVDGEYYFTAGDAKPSTERSMVGSSSS